MLLLPVCAAAQEGHAHNDYEHRRPLFDALERGFTSIEADVYLVKGALLVAHKRDSVDAARTLEGMYLAPLREYVRKRGHGPQLQLLIDVKSNAESTYAALDPLLRRYADVFASPGDKDKPLVAVISGERDTATMSRATRRYASVDGRTANMLSPSTLVPLISEDWEKFTKGLTPDSARKRLAGFVALAHENGKKVRFWATPDNAAMWTLLADAGVDYIGADDLDGLSEFLARRRR